MKTLLILVVLLIQLVHGYNVSYDHRSVIIDGERRLLISGSVHYPRSTPALWPVILQQSKDAGIDVIETYVFWNLHEPTPGVYNFEGNANITLFLDHCKEIGLYVNLRIGPYICGEYNYGGFPVWLKDIPGVVFRDYNDPFMNEMSKWMTYITGYLREYFADRGGPIILAQVENEYGWLEAEYGVTGRLYAEWAIEFALTLDVGVPWIMCMQGDIVQAINTCNGFYCHEFIKGHWEFQYDAPPMFTENWAGWFQNYGEAVPHRPTQDLFYSVLRWFAYGGNLMNYYMWHGGTNFGRSSGGPFIITSYDYDVAIDEYGMPYEPKYTLSANLHAILHKFEAFLVETEVNPPIPLDSATEASVFSIGNDSLIFITNFGNESEPSTVVFQGVTYTVNPWSVQLSFNGFVLFDTSDLPEPPKEPSADPIYSFFKAEEQILQYTEPVGLYTPEQSIQSPYPLEQINVTQDTSDYLAYLITISDPVASNILVLNNTNDLVHIFINNNHLGFFYGPLINTSFQIEPSVESYNITVICMTVGLVNWGAHMELYSRGINGDVILNSKNITQSLWMMKPRLSGEDLEIYTPGKSNSVTWTSFDQASHEVPPFTWFRVTVDNLSQFVNTSVGIQAFALNMTSMTKGLIWVNDNFVGRYWITEAVYPTQCDLCDTYPAGEFTQYMCRTGCGEPSQSIYHLPVDWLNFNNDIITILEEFPNMDPRSISIVQLNNE